MGKTEATLLSLMRRALGVKEQGAEISLTEKEWREVVSLAIDQAVLGLLFGVMNEMKLSNVLPLKFVVEIYSKVAVIKNSYEEHINAIRKVVNLLETNKIDAAFMRGETIAARYPDPSLRMCGDVDFVVDPRNFNKTLDALEEIATVDRGLVHEHHGMARIGKVTLEPHYKVHNFQSPKNDREMMAIFREDFPRRRRYVKVGDVDVPVFPPEMEAVMMATHIVNHLYAEGLGLRQLIDYRQLMEKEGAKFDKKLLDSYLRRMRATRTHRLLVCVCEKYLGLSKEIFGYKYSRKEIDFADKLMEDILAMGNFGRRSGVYGNGAFNNYLYVVGRCVKLGYFCPSEARGWPFSKVTRYFRKKISPESLYEIVEKSEKQ